MTARARIIGAIAPACGSSFCCRAKKLTTKHSIPATRLKAVGTGPVAPLAPNETEEGRAKNRRVELVQQ